MKDKLRPDHKVYGPYTRKNGPDKGRSIVILYRDKKRKTISYPKWIMEQHLNRFLEDDETVDHIDRDVTNNKLSNLQILSRAEHARVDALRNVFNYQKLICFGCKQEFLASRKSIQNVISKNSAGPFCSRVCSGRYGASVQNNKQQKIASTVNIVTEKYKYKK
jgi:hypothetical protein